MKKLIWKYYLLRIFYSFNYRKTMHYEKLETIMKQISEEFQRLKYFQLPPTSKEYYIEISNKNITRLINEYFITIETFKRVR